MEICLQKESDIKRKTALSSSAWTVSFNTFAT